MNIFARIFSRSNPTQDCEVCAEGPASLPIGRPRWCIICAPPVLVRKEADALHRAIRGETAGPRSAFVGLGRYR